MSKKHLKSLTLDALLLALLIISAQISITIGLTKFTLQLILIYIIGYVCNLKHSLLILTTYILMGLIGIPVFASFGGGFSYLLSPTFGFVYGFYIVLLMLKLNQFLIKKKPNFQYIYTILFSFISLILLYLIGYIHGYISLNILSNKSYDSLTLLWLFIVPYIPFDIIKIFLAILLYKKIAKYLDKETINLHFKNIDSTSTYLKNNYQNLKNLTFVSADYQTNGHGRMNRKWESNEKENLMFSVLIKDKELIEKYTSISLASAVAVYKSLIKLKLKNVSIKWPNDVYVGNKKICGILLESISEKEILCLVVGIGININTKIDNSLKDIATSYFEETNKKISINRVKRYVYKELNNILTQIKNNNINYLQIANEYNYLKNKTVYAEYLGIKVLVKVLQINSDNSLKVLLNNQEKNIYSGEITFHLS